MLTRLIVGLGLLITLLLLAVPASATTTTTADPVTGLAAASSQTSITWTWQAPASGSNGYGVTIDGTYAGQKPASDPSWTAALPCGTTHTISVRNWLNGTKSTPAASTASTLACTTTGGGTIKRVVVIIGENTNYELTRGHMPYLDSLANNGAYFTQSYAITHPSLPNYMALTSGQAIPSSACEPGACSSGADNIFHQLGSDWRDWTGGVKPCDKQISTGYDPDHNPAVYYTDIASLCASNDLPFAQFDLAAAAFHFVTFKEPQQYPAAFDKQLSTWLPAHVLSQPEYQDGSTLVLITFDEGNFKTTLPFDHVYTVAVNPGIKPGTVISTRVTHYSLLRTVQDLLGVPCLANTCAASSFATALGVS